MTLAVMMTCGTGCQTFRKSDSKGTKLFSAKRLMPWRKDDGPREGVPVRMVGAWTDTVLHQPGQAAQRGFGGRVMFYDKENQDPILVDGQLVVYAFDESNREPLDNRPTRRYVFPADQVALRKSESELGAGYSFWLPWDDAGGPQTEVSLICRFEPQGGSVVVSEQTRHLLPGAMGPGTQLAGVGAVPKLPEGVPSRPSIEQMAYQHGRAGVDGVQQAGFEATDEATSALAGRRMTTTSITLPPNYQLPARSASAAPAAPRQRTAPHSEHQSTRPLPQRPTTPERQAQTRPQPFPPRPLAFGAAVVPSPILEQPHIGEAAATPPLPAASGPAPAAPVVGAPTTTVSYLSPADSLRWEMGQRSFGSAPVAHPAPSTPGVR